MEPSEEAAISSRAKFCNKHPSEPLFEELTPAGDRIRRTCLTCLAEQMLPERLKQYEATSGKPHPVWDWGKVWVVLFYAYICGRLGGFASALAGMGYDLGALIGGAGGFFWGIYAWIRPKRNTTERNMPTLESVLQELEDRRRVAAWRVESFKAKLKQQYVLKTSGIHEVDSMSGRQFEEFVADVLKRLGYRVQLTPASGDLGVDLLIEKEGEKTAVQCKRRQPQEVLGPGPIQEVYAGKDLCGCSKALVITNCRISQQAQHMATKLGVEVWDRERLISVLSQTQKRVSWEEYLRRYYVE